MITELTGVPATWFERYTRGVHQLRSGRCSAVTKRLTQCLNDGRYVLDDERDLYTVCAAHRKLLARK